MIYHTLAAAAVLAAAALALLEVSMSAAAKEVAGLMDDGPERNEVLAILAKG